MVLKFGGSSFTTSRSWEKIRGILTRHLERGRRVFVVCSALSGISQRLHGLYQEATRSRLVESQLRTILAPHVSLARELGVTEHSWLSTLMGELLELCQQVYERPCVARKADLIAFGERFSSALGVQWLCQQGLPADLLDARQWLQSVGEHASQTELDAYLSAFCRVAPDPTLRAHLQDARLVVTQGFTARHPATGDTVLLGKGGSDTLAAYFAVKLQAESVEIWSDVPGMFTAHPQRFPEARLLRQFSYEEAEVLATRGGKALHPRCLHPLQTAGIPLRMGWTQFPEVQGTTISSVHKRVGIKAISSRRVCLLSMRREPCWQPVGFMAQVAECFRRHRLSMDLISSGPAEIRTTIDIGNTPDFENRLPPLREALASICTTQINANVVSISLVGHVVSRELYRLPFKEVIENPIHMGIHAPDDSHVSYVIDASVEEAWLRSLHRALFSTPADDSLFGPRWQGLTKQAPLISWPPQKPHKRKPSRPQA